VASLTYFLFRYGLTFAVVTPGPFRPGDVAWDVLLFSAFALHHSVLAREPIRRRLLDVFPNLERSAYVWVASLLFLVVCWLWRAVAGVVWDVTGAMRWVFGLIQIAGLVLSVYSAALIDVWELAGVKQPDVDGHFEFRTKGPYGYVRHPIYSGWFLIVFSVGTMTMTRFVFAIVSCVYVLIAIPLEERSLRRSSHGAYERYMKHVPWKLIPHIY